MYEGDMQSVLRCGQCNKPFDKQSTLKRHGYYCRSRRVGSTTRSRSCISCARAKARCDNRRPECSRCTTKAIECHYPADMPKDQRPRFRNSEDAPTKQRIMAPSFVVDSSSVENHQEANNNDDIIVNSALDMSDPDFANPGGEYLDWDYPDIDFADFLNARTDEEAAQYPSSGSSALVRPSTLSIDQTVNVQQAISSPNLSIPTLPRYTLRWLIQRPKVNTGAQRIASLLFQTLKSYPMMVLRHNTLPPFIHPRLISSNIENNYMEPLTNCISLVHMISSGIQGSRKLFWKNVRLECERLCEVQLSLNKLELLAAMQALSIYILIRLDEGEMDYNNFDFLLSTTVTAMSIQFNCNDTKYGTQSTPRNHGLEISWTDWIFEESRRRLSVVYRVLNMLVYFEPTTTTCTMQTDLILAPLPAKRQLWEAGNEYAWKEESEREPGVQTAFALAANGDLVELDDGQQYCSNSALLYKPLNARTTSSGATGWEEWCSGMDGFGGLVLLAAASSIA